MSLQISIHALLAESDSSLRSRLGGVEDFYPRSPCGERRVSLGFAGLPPLISIHALLAESDQNCRSDKYSYLLFLSTLSLRRATPCGMLLCRNYSISIHALLAESDSAREGR